jgi:hypothetical protein
MRTHRFGRKIKLPATIAIKHQIRMRMAQYEVEKAEAEAKAEAFRDQPSLTVPSGMPATEGLFTPHSEQYRAKAAEYNKRGKKTDAPNEIREFKNLERTFSELADNEEWMEHNSEKIVHRPAQGQK